ncbi:molybdenum cofactor guanylyltransferase [Lacimicrobium alkaliphilum]|uniref:Molybdenum cofactor guanylyltransferase n=1 Tax=Lacimicrobium alkaliphilum TaxID=1526571 RepID=A0ABQ1RS68_9ALTE|nr:molybdenum cofactor guanylyltransferase [Lacimicrobium alkaliphilum]GGD77787.1 molybdenum cofactor guanylyltransferase [Lacimicrobium alkaliphilum]
MKLSAVILAGGQSSRMGVDKATLVLAGQSLLEHCVERIKVSGCDRIRISRNQPGYLQDRFENAGPLGGIEAAANQLPAEEFLLVVPVDMPLLSPELLSTLINHSHQHRCSCYFQSSYLPACLLLSDKLKDTLFTQLSNEGQGSVKGLLQSAEAQALPCDQEQRLINVNTPQQWQALLTQIHPLQYGQALASEQDSQLS